MNIKVLQYQLQQIQERREIISAILKAQREAQEEQRLEGKPERRQHKFVYNGAVLATLA